VDNRSGCVSAIRANTLARHGPEIHKNVGERCARWVAVKMRRLHVRTQCGHSCSAWSPGGQRLSDADTEHVLQTRTNVLSGRGKMLDRRGAWEINLETNTLNHT
jgi:hypothetical protein